MPDVPNIPAGDAIEAERIRKQNWDPKFADRYATLGGEGGMLGKALDADITWEESNGGDWIRRFAAGALCGGTSDAVFEIHGAIYQKWVTLGAGAYGWPTTDETGTPDGKGRFNHFQSPRRVPPDIATADASIYWTADTGAYEVHGAIRDRWAQLGWETGYLGYPTSDETDNADNTHTKRGDKYGRFQGGFVSWRPEDGPHEHRNGAPSSFTINSMRIYSLRSGHRDTDVLSMQVQLQGVPVAPNLIVEVGTYGVGGPYQLGQTVPFTVDDPAAAVVMSFMIVNSADGATADLRKKLDDGFTTLATEAGAGAGAAIGAAIGGIGGPIGAAIGAVIGAVGALLAPILFANCDGVVVADTVHVSGATLNDATAGGSQTQSKDYPGLDSHAGCGDNSHYGVTWAVA